MILQGLESFENQAQNAALANEFKGNLFEYLVGLALARSHSLETSFLANIPASFRQQLSYYETWLRTHDLALLKSLPLLATEAARFFEQHHSLVLSDLALVGKLATGPQHDQFSEADLVLFDQQMESHYLSVKFCKVNAFVNTKSGGIGSFLSKYFHRFPSSQQDQQQLNGKNKFFFDCMGKTLYDMAELEWPGHFDQQWVNSGHSELPGQLPAEMNQVLLHYYSQVIAEIHLIFSKYYQHNPQVFAQALWPLMGLSDEKMTILSCFYRATAEQPCKLDHFKLERIDSEVLKTLSFSDFKSSVSSFELKFASKSLQIRVKPMNKFTVPGLKINCSVKATDLKGE